MREGRRIEYRRAASLLIGAHATIRLLLQKSKCGPIHREVMIAVRRSINRTTRYFSLHLLPIVHVSWQETAHAEKCFQSFTWKSIVGSTDNSEKAAFIPLLLLPTVVVDLIKLCHAPQ